MNSPKMENKLTPEQVWGNDEIMGLNAELNLSMNQIMKFIDAVEDAHDIGGNGIKILTDALEKLAKLGNGNMYGNSIGNSMAYDALMEFNNFNRKRMIKMHTIENTDGSKISIPDVKQCWSIDSEDFLFESLGELIDNYSDSVEVGQVVYFGDAVANTAGEYLNVDSIIEQMGERAYDECGECAEGYPDVSPDAIKELDELLISWGNKYCTPNFHVVENIREYTLTKDDLGDICIDID